MSPLLPRALGLIAVAAAAAGVVVLWPEGRREAPVVLDGPALPSARSEGPKRAAPRERTLPPKEDFCTAAEATLLASALDKVDLGIGPPLPPAAAEDVLDWPRVHRALLDFPGVYLRWESEAVREEVLKTPFEVLLVEFPTGAPKEGLVAWGPLLAEVQQAGFRAILENPVVWIGRRE